ncbi:MAG: hypothetical protein D3923_08655, partial [Candidatus Electrothrix sp. AR3]|nr:hypothetical protein [Candidatus Electrothrix sp. AR3]
IEQKKTKNKSLDFIQGYVHYIQLRVDIIIRTRYNLSITFPLFLDSKYLFSKITCRKCSEFSKSLENGEQGSRIFRSSSRTTAGVYFSTGVYSWIYLFSA